MTSNVQFTLFLKFAFKMSPIKTKVMVFTRNLWKSVFLHKQGRSLTWKNKKRDSGEVI